MVIKKLVNSILASVAIDLFLIGKTREDGFYQPKIEESLAEEEQKKEIFKHRRKPRRWKRIFKDYKSPLHYQSTKSRNVRDLDQRKIRRKFHNC